MSVPRRPKGRPFQSSYPPRNSYLIRGPRQGARGSGEVYQYPIGAAAFRSTSAAHANPKARWNSDGRPMALVRILATTWLQPSLCQPALLFNPAAMRGQLPCVSTGYIRLPNDMRLVPGGAEAGQWGGPGLVFAGDHQDRELDRVQPRRGQSGPGIQVFAVPDAGGFPALVDHLDAAGVNTVALDIDLRAPLPDRRGTSFRITGRRPAPDGPRAAHVRERTACGVQMKGNSSRTLHQWGFRYSCRYQRGWVTTSIRAGSPRLTTCSARRMAGPRSLGSVIGPSA